MSTRSSLKDLPGPRVRVRDVPRVASGSRGKFLLQSNRARSRARRPPWRLRSGISLCATRTRSPPAFSITAKPWSNCRQSRDLAACNVVAKAYGPPPRVDVKAIRETMEMSQEQFALEFGLELATVRNWEQCRSEPDTAARNFLVTIAHDPKAVRHALVIEG